MILWRYFILAAVVVAAVYGFFGLRQISREKFFLTRENGEIIVNETKQGAATVTTASGTPAVWRFAPTTQFFNKEGALVDAEYLRPGFSAIADGRWEGEAFRAEKVRILEEPGIIVWSPRPNETANWPIQVSGEARVFENAASYRLKDSRGNILFEGYTVAQSPDSGLYGRFNIQLGYASTTDGLGIIEIFNYSAKDGSEENIVRVPVVLGTTEGLVPVQVYFGNEIKNPDFLDCAKVFPVIRMIPATTSMARAALAELLRGVTTLERKDGFLTSLNNSVGINSLTIGNGTARVDFDDRLDFQVGGSCRVTAIRAQIETTLKQFATVKNVVISINSRTEDILQP